jgi:hypothetical protein
MDDRINAWLDGEIPLEALEPEARTEARALQATLGAAARRLSAVPLPDLTARVMEALPPAPARPAPTPAGRSSWDALRARLRAWPRALAPTASLGLRPAVALAAFALVIGFALGTLLPGPEIGGPAAAGTGDEATAPQLFVRFELRAPGATDVRLAGSFTGWQPGLELTPAGDDRWAVTVPLEPGVHDYVFVVDGEQHVIDPYAARVADGFGGYNSRLAIVTPAT